MRTRTSPGRLALALRISLAVLLVAALPAPPAPPVRADALLVVIFTGDSSTVGTLRSAILAANAAGGGTITFDESLAGKTILLDSPLPVITANLDIDAGRLSEPVTISGGGRVRVLESAPSVVLNLIGLIITGGQASDGCGGISAGGILLLQRCSVVGNRTEGDGGGACAGFHAVVTDSTISDNTAKGSGGGLRVNWLLQVQNSTISGNAALGHGGGAYVDRDVDLIESTISGNSAWYSGGGVVAGGAVRVSSSTLEANEALDVGGALLAEGKVEITNSTLAANAARVGGAVFAMGGAAVLHSTFRQNRPSEMGAHLVASGVVTLTNNIFAGAAGTIGDCWYTTGTPTLGANLVQNGDCSATVTGDPLLGLLGDHGGPTPTFTLSRGSPAVDAGDADACPATDQRDLPRPAGAGCDLGAVEARVPWALTDPPPPLAVDATSATVAGQARAFDGPADVSCEIGLDASYGASVPATPAEVNEGEQGTVVTCTFADLMPNTTYHYRVVATGVGGTADGGDSTFTTLAPVAYVVAVPVLMR